MSGKAERFLAELAADLRQEIVAIGRMDSALVDGTSPRGDARPPWDAAGRICGPKSSKNWNGRGSAKQIGVSGNSTATSGTMRRRVQLAKGWKQYEAARREAGNNGQYGLVYGLSLIRAESTGIATNAHRLSSVLRIQHRRSSTSPAVSSSPATRSPSFGKCLLPRSMSSSARRPTGR